MKTTKRKLARSPGCRCCGNPTRHTTTAGDVTVPMCPRHEDRWNVSGERQRATAARGQNYGAKRQRVALQDFINRQRAELREHGGRT